MRRRKIIPALALLAAAGAAQGCYTRVVDARGIGGDSEKLRHEHERATPLRGLTTSTEREKKPSSGVW